jgi:3D (Asp-Asp-Asp) domain-containing protein
MPKDPMREDTMRRPFASLLLMLCAAASAAAQDRFSLPPPHLPLPAPKRLWATHYNVHAAAAQADGLPLLARSGHALGPRLAPRDWCLAALEGTVAVTSAAGTTTYNYAGKSGTAQVDCVKVLGLNATGKPWASALGRSRFKRSRGPYGEGTGGFDLAPYRTIAVDPGTLAFGSVVYIPSARGQAVTLPDGTSAVHDGYFFAADTGGAIRQTHIDVFCGVATSNCFPGFVHSDAKKTFDAFVVKDADTAAFLSGLHRPTADTAALSGAAPTPPATPPSPPPR